MTKKRYIIAAVGLIVVVACLFGNWYDYHKSYTIEEAIEEDAIEGYECISKVIETVKIEDRTVCIFQSKDNGIGFASLENERTEENPRYKKDAYKHIPFILIDGEFDGEKNHDYYVLNEEKEIMILCGVYPKSDKNYAVLNNNKIKMNTYLCEDTGKNYSYWVGSVAKKDEDKINFSLN